MSLHPVPSLPFGVARVDHRWFENSHFELHYAVSPIPTAFNMAVGVNDWVQQIHNFWFLPASDFRVVPNLPWLFLNWDGVVHSSPLTTGPYHTFHNYGSYLNLASCPCWTKRSTNRQRHYTGRLFGFPIPPQFIDTGGEYSAVAVAALEDMRQGLLATWDSQGSTFFPVVLSRATGLVALITDFSLCNGVRTVARRYARKQLGQVHWTFPVVP